MADKSRIEWTEATWNPTTGCDRVSPGCDNCYAMTLAPRLKAMGSKRYQRDGNPATSGPGFGLSLHSDTVGLPLRWTKPRRIFVNSMSDLFHTEVPDRFIADVFAVMTIAERHTFQLLTKRHGRMRSLLSSVRFWRDVSAARNVRGHESLPAGGDFEPPPNVWIGVSVEDQQRADLRIPALLDTPAAVRWLSMEPLLGPVDLCNCHPGGATALTYEGPQEWCNVHGRNRIDWVVAGGESGGKARPMRAEWAQSLRDQCTTAGVPFFMKQWGEHVAPDQMPEDVFMDWDAIHGNAYDPSLPWRIGKRRAGRLLDGRTWDEYPADAS